MRTIQIITPTEMRVINRSAILALIRKISPISRSAIAERLDVSLPTVMRIVDDLVEEGLVRPLGVTEWSGGRRRSLLEFNARSQVMIGARAGAKSVYCVAADLAGTVLVENTRDLNGAQGEDACNLLVESLAETLESGRSTGLNIRGVGVGVPGLADYDRGVVCDSPSLGWLDLPLRDRLETRFELPVLIDHDTHLAALGEAWYGNGQNTTSFIYINIGDCLDAGIVLNGVIYRGARQMAGKIGAMLPGREYLGLAGELNGGMESIASLAGAVQHARAALKNSLTAERLNNLTAAEVLAAGVAGEEWAAPIVSDLVDYLVIAVAALAAAYDPELIALGGEDIGAVEALLPLVTDRLRASLPNPPRLVASRLGRRAAALGAVTILLHNTGEFYTVQRMA